MFHYFNTFFFLQRSISCFCKYSYSLLKSQHFQKFMSQHYLKLGFPGGPSGKEPTCQCRRQKRRGFDPWIGKIPWRRAEQPTPVLLPGESHGQRSLVGYSPQGNKDSDMTKMTQHACIIRSWGDTGFRVFNMKFCVSSCFCLPLVVEAFTLCCWQLRFKMETWDMAIHLVSSSKVHF